VAGVDARRATPPDPRLARWGLASCCQLDASHPADWNDANADYQKHRGKLPPGTKIRAFSVEVEEIENAYEGVEIKAT